MKKIFVISSIFILFFSKQILAKDYTLFWVINKIQHPKTLCGAGITINEVHDNICSLGAGNYCSTEKLITLKTILNNQYRFTLSNFNCIDTGEVFTNIDSSCKNLLLEIKPNLTTIVIEGTPSTILTKDTRLVCRVKDYYEP